MGDGTLARSDRTAWSERQRQVIDEFRANAGTVGGHFAGMPLLLLTTTGARTGRPRTTALRYLPDGARYVVVAANAGAHRHPDWFHNLTAHPAVTVEVGAETFAATAVLTTGEQRDALIERIVADSPNFVAYQAATAREIPVVLLDRRP
ncbi:hypothetical protein GCM10023322_40340 [Rugosimonospora acidiphila]|uniref:Nitroreductase family deazaflavin-dependent oxidoreductase n=1 Tax=Rugosimonospora acidiphila TaxID=556531 RepID=A0ABP9RZU9_9ACTN